MNICKGGRKRKFKDIYRSLLTSANSNYICNWNHCIREKDHTSVTPFFSFWFLADTSCILYEGMRHNNFNSCKLFLVSEKIPPDSPGTAVYIYIYIWNVKYRLTKNLAIANFSSSCLFNDLFYDGFNLIK